MLVLLVPILVEQLQHNCLAKSNCYESESATKRCQRRSKSRLIDKDGTDVTILIDPFHATDHLNQRPFSLAAAVANIFTTYCQWKGEKTTEVCLRYIHLFYIKQTHGTIHISALILTRHTDRAG